jgi:cap1 methyltransferase
MDPTIKYTKLEVSFNKEEIGPDSLYVYHNTHNNVESDIVTVSEDKIPEAKYCDLDLYHKVLKNKNKLENIDNKDYQKYRKECNPYDNLNTGLFKNRAGIKLGNIDALYNVTGIRESMTRELYPENNPIFYFLDLAGGPGSWIEYLFFRVPKCQGLGMTLKSMDYYPHIIKDSRFSPIYGDGSGDLYTQYRDIIKEASLKTPTNFNLVTADGGFETEYNLQEWMTSKLLLIEAYLGIILTRKEGNFIMKIFDANLDITAQIIYMVSFFFENTNIIKLASSRPANSERYVVFVNRKDTNEELINPMKNAIEEIMDKDIYAKSLIKELPSDFTKWLTEINNINLESQLNSLDNIINMSKGEEVNIIPADLSKTLLMWRMPVHIKYT